jgi:hypothetical protein
MNCNLIDLTSHGMVEFIIFGFVFRFFFFLVALASCIVMNGVSMPFIKICHCKF